MKKPMKPGGASPGYGSPGYGPGSDKDARADNDARSSGDFGAPLAPRGGRRAPGVRRGRPISGGGGFGHDYDDGRHDHDDREGGY